MDSEKEFENATNLVVSIENEIAKFDSLTKRDITADTLSAFINDICKDIDDLVTIIERNIKDWKNEHIEFFLDHRVLKNRYKIFEIPRALIDIYTVTPAKYSIVLAQPTDSVIEKKILTSIEALMQLEKSLRVAENTRAGNILEINLDDRDERKKKFARLLSSLESDNEFKEFSSLITILRHHKEDLIRFFLEEQ